MSVLERIKGKFFKRFQRGAPLCQIPLADSLEKVANVLETIEGDDNITISKPTQLNGLGWRIRFSGELPENVPQLFDGRINASGSWEIYCGENGAPVLQEPTSGQIYTSPYSGWHDTGLSGNGVIYFVQTGSSGDITTTAPSGETGQYSITLGTVWDGVYYKKVFGILTRKIDEGDDNNKLLMWQTDTKSWTPATAADVNDFLGDKSIVISNTDDGTLTPGTETTIITSATVDTADGHKILTHTQKATIPDTTYMVETTDLTQLTVITDIQWDSTTHSIQVKTRTLKAYDLGTESGWSSKINFTSFNS